MANYNNYHSIHKTFYYGLNDGKNYEITIDKPDLEEAAELSEDIQGLGEFDKPPTTRDIINRLKELAEENE